MNHIVITSLLPVVLLIATGFIAGKRAWIGATSVKDLSNLVFLLLSPALLFRAMSGVHIEQLDLGPVGVYFLSAGLIFAATLAVQGWGALGAVLALCNTYSNAVAIGIPLIGLAYGPQGMVAVLTLVSLHAVVILTGATVVLELAQSRATANVQSGPSLWVSVAQAVRNAILHPVPVPIIVGLLFAQTGWVLPEVLDRPLQLLGQAFGPLALVLVGVTLANTAVGPHLRQAFGLSLVKNVAHPALMAALGWAFGLHGLPLTVMVVAAALPMGANVFLFAQRYNVAEALVTASVAVSTALALVTLSVVMAWAG